MSAVRSALLLSFLVSAGCGIETESFRNRKKADDQPHIDSLLARGERLYTAERYDSARAAWTQALSASKAAHDDVARARALTSLGVLSGRLGDLKHAEEFGNEALSIKTRLGLVSEVSSSYHALGLAALDADNNDSALTLFQHALDAAKKSNDVRGTAKAYGGAGLAYAYLGDLAQSRQSQRAARLAAVRIDDRRLQANAMANEAMVDIWEGNALPAIALLDTARSLYRREAYAAGEQNALGQLATAYELTGREDLALATLDSSLAISQRLGLKEQEADLLRLIAGVHLRLGDYREALSTFSRAESMLRPAGLNANLGSVLRGEAEAYFRLGDLPRASERLRLALVRHSLSSEPLERFDDVLLGAEIDYRIAGMDRAKQRLNEARVIAEKIGTRGSRLTLVLMEAHVADLATDSRSVLRLLKGVDSELRAGDLGVEWTANALKSRAYGRLGELDSARATGLRAVAAIARLRGSLASEALRSTYVADRADVYGDLVVTLLRMNRPSEAFEVADAARSHALLDHLASTEAYASSRTLSPEIADQEHLLKRIDDLIQRLRATDRNRSGERGFSTASAVPGVEAELVQARSEYEALAARTAQSHVRSTSILGARPVRLEEVRASLTADEALIEYMFIPRHIVAFVVSRDTMLVVMTPIDGSALVQRLRLLADLWGQQNPHWKLGLTVSRTLYRTLMSPVLEQAKLHDVRHLIIVPHGILAELPFAALNDGARDRFLVQDYTITNLPTASALTALRQQQRPLQVGELGGFGFAPFNGRSELPASESEVEAFRAAARGRTTSVGNEATEARLRLALAQDGIVHVATHGIMNLRSPLFSRVELAPHPGSGSQNDGRLEVHELLGLSIRSSLVFLSGCETGAGAEWLNDPVRGTGNLTMAQAILSAGAGNVITTLWRIGDKGAARFAEIFYGQLRNLSLENAFAATQRAMAGASEYNSPYYWAGYVLAGDGKFSVHRKMAALNP